ncbi:MAG: ABC transporter ATP-binding protein [Sporolactobacillus sp.]
MVEPIMELRKVCKQFKGFALKDVSFQLNRGFIMGFIGANGAGKSTTIRCILDLVHPGSGEVRLFGAKMTGNSSKLKQRVGFVFDQDVFFSGLTVAANARVLAPFYEKWDQHAFLGYCDQFGLPLEKKVKTLSKGTKMKLALAVALSHHAELIIMDEPTSGLDPIFRKELLDCLLDVIQDDNKAIFFSTHNTSDLEKVADYITFIRDGEILMSEETDRLLERFVSIRGPKAAMADVQAVQPLTLKQTAFGIEAFAESVNTANLNRTELTIEPVTLEDIMYHFRNAEKGRA